MRRQAQIPWLGLLLLLAGVIDRLFLPLSHLPTHVLLVMGVALIAFHAGVFGAAGAMAALASKRAPIDVFFDKVTVNDADSAVRARRLNLLARFRDAVNAVADFSKIEG